MVLHYTIQAIAAIVTMEVQNAYAIYIIVTVKTAIISTSAEFKSVSYQLCPLFSMTPYLIFW